MGIKLGHELVPIYDTLLHTFFHVKRSFIDDQRLFLRKNNHQGNRTRTIKVTEEIILM
jgi:hypothetical protein